MTLKPTLLQALFARRREVEHNRIERSEAVNKYFDHWGKVTARFESWTTPGYYKQANQELENTKQEKEKQKILAERQEKLGQLFELEKKYYEQEMRDKERNKSARRSVDIKTLVKVDENLKLQQQIKRKLQLEAKLYGRWRHGVDDDNLIFQSKSDNEVLAKLNWLDKQIDQQLQREKEEDAAKELQLKLQSELNKSDELQKERQLIREKEIRELRCMQEQHLEQLKERQKETDEFKEKEKQLKDNLSNLNKELELLEESYSVVCQAIDFGDAYNFKNIKIFTRKRSEVFRNQIKLCLGILERIMRFCTNCQLLDVLKKRLAQQLENEVDKLGQIEGMYESEAKYTLKRSEELWQLENTKNYKELKHIMMDEHAAINNSIKETFQRLEGLLEIRGTHLAVIESCSEKLKLLIQEGNSARFQKPHDIQLMDESKNEDFSSQHQVTKNECNRFEECNDISLNSPRKNMLLEQVEPCHQVDFSSRRNCYESNDNNMSPGCNGINRISNSFNNLNLDACQVDLGQISQRDFNSQRTNSQRSLQVVTADTEAERPRFGRKRVVWN